MPGWHDIHKHMRVYSADQRDLGHVADVYEDSFLVRKGIFFLSDRYIPYSAIATITGEQVQLTMSAAEANDKEWSKRPDYEEHLGDPTQLMYDRGHGVHDPFEGSQPEAQ
ncbi:MAG: DUF2171 domain-containing protein [Ktedonobacteraceae bacterium]|nr:DUF2171 domain-containing protein [Ktedonobacteraceae bacterium]